MSEISTENMIFFFLQMCMANKDILKKQERKKK